MGCEGRGIWLKIWNIPGVPLFAKIFQHGMGISYGKKQISEYIMLGLREVK